MRPWVIFAVLVTLVVFFSSVSDGRIIIPFKNTENGKSNQGFRGPRSSESSESLESKESRESKESSESSESSESRESRETRRPNENYGKNPESNDILIPSLTGNDHGLGPYGGWKYNYVFLC